MSDEHPRQAPSSRFNTPSLMLDLRAEVASLRADMSGQRGHRQKAIFKHAGCTVALFALDAGARLPEHSAAGTVTIQAIEGEMLISADERTHRLGPQQVLILAPGVRHAVTAPDPAAFLLIVSIA